MITKTELDKLVEKYETIEFIKDDPIQFIHRGKSKEESELLGFIASLFAYGNRKVFIRKLEDIFACVDNDIVGFVKNGDFSVLKGIEYRFSKENDIIPVFEILSKLYNESRGLEELFEYGLKSAPTPTLPRGEGVACGIQTAVDYFYAGEFKSAPTPALPRGEGAACGIQTAVDYFYARAPKSVGHGFYHLIPNPANGGAMKRMNMFLRWMVRKGPVDLGIWSFIQPKDLLIPLDVHVARVSREMGLLKRKSNDYKAVLELMEPLREFCPDDPVKYDFAMFAFGVEYRNKIGG